MGRATKTKKVDLGPASKIPLGQGLCFKIEGREIAVFRKRSGDIAALDNRCPHKQGPLCEGLTDSREVVCPYHAHKFDLKTGLGSEAGEKVETYFAEEKNGNIILDF